MLKNIAVLQLNPIVGDIAGNFKKIVEGYENARAQGAELVVTGECALTGYPIEDLVLRPSFMEAVEEQAEQLIKLIALTDGPSLIFGTPMRIRNGLLGANKLYNTAILAYSLSDYQATFGNTVTKPMNYSVHAKHELPNYGVFDEKRVFNSSPVHDIRAVKWHDFWLGIMVCEDTWFPTVSRELALSGADFLISINGSPYEDGKRVTRRQIVANRMKETGLPMLYVNLVGGQDELVFDGGSFGFDGETMFEMPEFAEIRNHWNAQFISQSLRDLPLEGERLEPTNHPLDWSKWVMVTPGDVGHTYRASVLATQDYLQKQGFTDVVIGYSGGVDSGLVAAIAVDALGPEHVTLVSLPSKFSSQHSKDDAQEGAKRLGAEYRVIQIEPVVAALRMAYQSQVIPGNFEDPQDFSRKLTGTADENIQARARGTILMAISNQEGKVVLTTGNKSEVSVGYATLYGDMAGGFNPIKDFYKTRVWAACRWRNALDAGQCIEFGLYGPHDTDVVPEEIIVKPPSAELRPDQMDSDSLPPYEVLDDILHKMIEEELSVKDIINSGHKEEQVLRVRRLVDIAEYKRRQSAPGVKTTNKLHGRERRYPIVNKWRN